MNPTKTVGRTAISYIRFSTPRQEHGISLERQTTGAEEFCQRHNLYLDEKLSIRDLGKSAHKGKNASTGHLAVFLEAIRQNKVPKGTVLVVEALDRLTRNSIVEATHLLTDILRKGVDIGLVTEDKIYSLDYINKNPFELLVATTYLIRGGDESGRKSFHTTKNWKDKKERIAKGEAVRFYSPFWIKYVEIDNEARTGKWTVVEDRASIVKQIFSDYLHGDMGIWMLVHKLNESKTPVVTSQAEPGSMWNRVTLHRLLKNKAAMGTYPYTEPPTDNYFPAIVSKEDFWAVQQKMKSRIRDKGRVSGRDINLFKGLCHCAKCGSIMTRITRTRGGVLEYRYLLCFGSVNGTCKPSKAVDLTKFEQAFMKYIVGSSRATAFFAEKEVEDKIPKELVALDFAITEKSGQRENLVTALSNAKGSPEIVLDRINSLAEEIVRLRRRKDELTAQLLAVPRLEENWIEFYNSRPKLDKLNSPDRLKLRELIRQFVRNMKVDPFTRTATFETVAGKFRTMIWPGTERGRKVKKSTDKPPAVPPTPETNSPALLA